MKDNLAIKKNLVDILGKISSNTVHLANEVIVNKTVFPDGMILKDKIEAKFDVIITDTAIKAVNSNNAKNQLVAN